ncbi:hypothetical protein CHARACLAT_030807 [Characodon lateralis]|uniref:Uncharacterized protein n=1 Tax=Characodon lateralis TaxID=208331 RepID=A0ABU7F8C0_9TELE|nr:hypothetical protein [Characodon lateralis]
MLKMEGRGGGEEERNGKEKRERTYRLSSLFKLFTPVLWLGFNRTLSLPLAFGLSPSYTHSRTHTLSPFSDLMMSVLFDRRRYCQCQLPTDALCLTTPGLTQTQKAITVCSSGASRIPDKRERSQFLNDVAQAYI